MFYVIGPGNGSGLYYSDRDMDGAYLLNSYLVKLHLKYLSTT